MKKGDRVITITVVAEQWPDGWFFAFGRKERDRLGRKLTLRPAQWFGPYPTPDAALTAGQEQGRRVWQDIVAPWAAESADADA